MNQSTRQILLYTKPGCRLCDEAFDLILTFIDALGLPLAIKEINILEDPALYERYRHAIPVITVDPEANGPTIFAPITPSKLDQALNRGKDAFDSSSDTKRDGFKIKGKT